MKKLTRFILPFLAAITMARGESTSVSEIESSYRKHAVAAQFYRWFLPYEVTEPDLTKQLDILNPEVVLVSPLGKASGHEAYLQAVGALPKNWKNAHAISNLVVKPITDQTSMVTADVDYANVGRLPDDAVYQSSLSYTGILTSPLDGLPKITELAISPKKTTPAERAFSDTYPTNRCLSLLHYWLHLVEHPERKAEPFRKLLAETYSLNYPSGEITTFEAFEKWIKGPASMVKASRHTLSNIVVTPMETANHFRLEATLDWCGILLDESQMTAQTRHIWQIIDDPTARFAKVSKIDVQITKAIQVIEKVESN